MLTLRSRLLVQKVEEDVEDTHKVLVGFRRMTKNHKSSNKKIPRRGYLMLTILNKCLKLN
jgi:hypothetical protein